MFDEFLRASRRTEPSGRSTPTTTTATSTASRGWTASATSSPPAASTLPEATRPTRPAARRCGASATARTTSCQELIETRGRRGLSRARCDYLQAARAAGLRRAVVSSSANAGRCSRPPASPDLFEARVDGVVADASRPAGQAGARTRSWPARTRSASTPQQAAVFEDALAGVEAGPAGGFGLVVGVDRVGQADGAARARRRHRGQRPGRAAPSRHPIDEAVVPGRARGACARRGSTSTCWPQSESVFALSNGHIGLRGNLDEGEPHGLPGTYLNSVYELRPLPYAEAGYGYPESGQTIVNVTNGKMIRLLVDDEPFDVRYGDLRCARARARPARRHADRERRVAFPGRRRRSGSAATRLVSFTQRAVAAIRYEVEPVDRPAAARPAVRAGRQRAAAAARRTTRGSPRARSAARAGGRTCSRELARRAGAPHQAQRAAGGGGDGPRGRRAGRHCGPRSRPCPDLARVTVTTRARSRASGCAS